MLKRPASHLLRRPAGQSDPAHRLRYEEASLEALREKVTEKERLVAALRKELYGKQLLVSASSLPSGRPYVRENFVDWTAAQVEEALNQTEGHRDRKRMRFFAGVLAL
jgi:hypothetical protein